MNKDLELLAPVGSMEALEAAIINGADAVYLGGKLFNARHYASNFDYEQLMEAVSYAHLRNVQVFITVNILLDDKEIPDALDYVKYLYEIGVDGVIVQDIGFGSLVRKLFPHIQVHASTQMTINNLQGAKHLEGLGFTRAVLAREVPIDEIRRIASGTSLELEVFVHGALCFSYSGQCLMSSLIGGRSGNRGTCAQPCRMEYSILDKKGEKAGNLDKGYFLSTRDLNTLDEIGELIEAGVKSFKIEGRMKRPEYVATVVSIYRKAIDKGSSSLTNDDRIDVEQMFNREFTKGLTFGDFGRSFVSVERPDNRGRVVGKVISANKNRIQVQLIDEIEINDGLEWDATNGQRSGTKAQFNGKAGEKIWIDRIRDTAKIGSTLRKTSSTKLLRKSRDSYTNPQVNNPVEMDMRIVKGEYPELKVFYKEFEVFERGEKTVEEALNSPITRDRVQEQISKLGDTVFVVDKLSIQMDEDVFITIKDLNLIRRNAMDKLQTMVLQNRRRNIADGYKNLKKEIISIEKKPASQIRLTVRVNNQAQLDQLNLDKVDRVYLNFTDNLDMNIQRLKANNTEAYYWSNKILYEDDLERMLRSIGDNLKDIDGISLSNLGTLEFIKSRFSGKMQGDIGLNAFNSYTVDYLREKGLSGIALSPELNLGQISTIASKTGGELEVIVYGYLPSMISRNCPMAFLKGCKDDKACSTCQYAHGYTLRDRMDKTFRMERGYGFTTIYNSVPVMVLDKLEDVSNSGVTSFRLDFTFEKDIRQIQEMYYDYLNGNIPKETVLRFMDMYKEEKEVTNGHFYRGVL